MGQPFGCHAASSVTASDVCSSFTLEAHASSPRTLSACTHRRICVEQHLVHVRLRRAWIIPVPVLSISFWLSWLWLTCASGTPTRAESVEGQSQEKSDDSRARGGWGLSYLLRRAFPSVGRVGAPPARRSKNLHKQLAAHSLPVSFCEQRRGKSRDCVYHRNRRVRDGRGLQVLVVHSNTTRPT